MKRASTLTRFSLPSEAERRRMDAVARRWQANQDRMEALSRLSQSCIPSEFVDARLTDTDVIAWLQDPGFGLLLKGRPGRGKTHQACAALSVLAGRCSVMFASATDVAAGYRSARGEESSFLASLTAPRALVIDDLGKERGWGALEAIFHVIDRRGQKKRPTIVTTNLDGKALLDKYAKESVETAEALISRLSRYTICEICGDDRRMA